MSEPRATPEAQCLARALDEQRSYLTSYEQPSEARAYETLRALDDLFCRDLMEPGRLVSPNESRFRKTATWGVNHALKRIIPRKLEPKPIPLHPTHYTIQQQANDFLYNCAALEIGERYEALLHEGVLSGEVRKYPSPSEAELESILLLRSKDATFSDEEVGRAGLRWSSRKIWERDRSAEKALEKDYLRLSGRMADKVALLGGWLMAYDSDRDIDDHFHDWGKLYLKRIFSQDLLAADDKIGGRPFSRYVEVLTALSGRSQKHIAFAAIAKAQNPNTHIRNLLTTHSDVDTFVRSISAYLGGDEHDIGEILRCLILTGDNLDIHTSGGEMAWAPIVQASEGTLLLPTYGMDINPFLFLLKDLRHRFESDWFAIANLRESRWIQELVALFEGPRWSVHTRNLRLKHERKDLTDIDFAVMDHTTNQLALFQLKWQHPVGVDTRGRRSTGKNLTKECNKWVEAVHYWLDIYGTDELLRRLNFKNNGSLPSVHLFVLGRYSAHFTGFGEQDGRAVWTDWAHFRRARLEGPRRSLREIKASVGSLISRAKKNKGESSMLKIGSTAVILNPKKFPMA